MLSYLLNRANKVTSAVARARECLEPLSRLVYLVHVALIACNKEGALRRRSLWESVHIVSVSLFVQVNTSVVNRSLSLSLGVLTHDGQTARNPGQVHLEAAGQHGPIEWKVWLTKQPLIIF